MGCDECGCRTCIICGATVFVIGIVVAILFSESLKKLDSYEVGLSHDVLSSKLDDETRTEGLHFGPPGFEFVIFSSVYQTLEFKQLKCLNKDGVEIVLAVTLQYLVRVKKLKVLVLQFRNHTAFKEILEYVGESAIHEACSQFNATQFQLQRPVFQNNVRVLMKQKYEELHTDVNDVQVNNIIRPHEYEEAVRQKETERENIKLAENERQKKVTEAETEKKEAETQAKITLEKAESNSRIIENRALAEAESILKTYEREAEIFEELTSSSGLGLTSKGLISYIGVRAIAGSKNPVYLSIKGPAKTSYP